MRIIISAALTTAVVFLAACGDSSGPSSDPGLHGWIAGDNSGSIPTILHTSDGVGWDFQGEDLTLPGADLSCVSVVDSTTCWLAGGSSDGFGVVLRTTDGGETWIRTGNETELPKPVLSVRAFSADVAWGVGDQNSIYMTDDGGVTWHDMSIAAYDGNDWGGVHGTSPSNIWVSGGTQSSGLILHTSDGGTLWTAHTDSAFADWFMISICAYDNQNIWAVGHGFTVVKSSDGGIQWEMVTPDSLQGGDNDANGITLISPQDAWVALDYGNIWRTGDGGATWEYQPIPQAVGGYFMLRISATDTNTAWVTGHSGFGTPQGVILHTSDGGATWERLDDQTIPGLWDVGMAGEYN